MKQTVEMESDTVPYQIHCRVRRSAVGSLHAHCDDHRQAPGHSPCRTLQGTRPRSRDEGRGRASARRERDGVGLEGTGARLVLGRFPSAVREGEVASVERDPSEYHPGMVQVAIGLDTSVVLRLLIGEPRLQVEAAGRGSNAR